MMNRCWRYVRNKLLCGRQVGGQLPPMSLRTLKKHFLALKTLIILAVAFMLPLDLALTVDGGNSKEARCAYVIVVMGILWLTEAIPIAVTALMPIFMFPMLGVAEAKDMSSAYVTDTTMLFLGGLVLAVAVEESNLHKRIAIGAMRLIGAHPSMLMLGLMLPTWFLSMWISNTAATSMMIPIIQAVIKTCEAVHKVRHDHNEEVNVAYIMDDISTEESVSVSEKSTETTNSQPASSATSRDNIVNINQSTPTDMSNQTLEMKRLAKGLCISVAYAANVGGIATLTGTPPNLVLKERADDLYKNMSSNAVQESPLSFAVWMGFAFPLSLLTLIIAWCWLQLLFLRGRCFKKLDPETKKAVNATIKKQYHSLGQMTFAEWMVLLNFIALVILWLFRDPPSMSGWGEMYYNHTENKKYISDSTPAILIGVILFIVPSRLPSVFCWAEDRDKPSYTPILTWYSVERKIPWGVIILLGGGFAIAKASKSSGLSDWLGNELKFFASYDPWLMNLIFALIVAAATEVTSNTATATLLMPILSALALSIGMHPLYLMITATIACSFAFMLPVATPPNAIVFSTGYLTISDMALAGLPMNIIAVLCLTLAVNSWGRGIFEFDNIPDYFLTGTTPSLLNSTNSTLG